MTGSLELFSPHCTVECETLLPSSLATKSKKSAAVRLHLIPVRTSGIKKHKRGLVRWLSRPRYFLSSLTTRIWLPITLVEGERKLLQIVLGLPHVCHGTYLHTPPQWKQNFSNIKKCYLRDGERAATVTYAVDYNSGQPLWCHNVHIPLKLKIYCILMQQSRTWVCAQKRL